MALTKGSWLQTLRDAIYQTLTPAFAMAFCLRAHHAQFLSVRCAPWHTPETRLGEDGCIPAALPANVLTDRVAQLEAGGLVKKRAYQTNAVRF